MGTVDLGTGRLNWHSDERRTDRYGTVHLNRDLDGTGYDPVRFDGAPYDEQGDLVAVVLETRHSAHIGDAFRGAVPSTPAAGDEITLGTGTLFVEEDRHGATQIGLLPDDGRDHDWLDPGALYRCHSQTVRLEFRTRP